MNQEEGGQPMPQSIKEVMTPNPVTLPTSAPLTEAAKAMRESDIGEAMERDSDSALADISKAEPDR
jgi:CBS domain-containing protein